MLLNDFHEKVLYKRETLLKEMIATEWGTHAHEMNENHTELKSKIERMKMAFADPEKKGSEVLSYNEPPKGQSRYHEVDGILTRKKNTSIYTILLKNAGGISEITFLSKYLSCSFVLKKLKIYSLGILFTLVCHLNSVCLLFVKMNK